MSKPFTSPTTEILYAVQRKLRYQELEPLKQIEWDLYEWGGMIFDFDPGRIPLLKKRELKGRIAIHVVSVEQVMSLIEENVKTVQTK